MVKTFAVKRKGMITMKGNGKFSLARGRVFDRDDVDYFIIKDANELGWFRYSDRYMEALYVQLKSSDKPSYVGYRGSPGMCLDIVDDIHAGKYDVTD